MLYEIFKTLYAKIRCRKMLKEMGIKWYESISNVVFTPPISKEDIKKKKEQDKNDSIINDVNKILGIEGFLVPQYPLSSQNKMIGKLDNLFMAPAGYNYIENSTYGNKVNKVSVYFYKFRTQKKALKFFNKSKDLAFISDEYFEILKDTENLFVIFNNWGDTGEAFLLKNNTVAFCIIFGKKYEDEVKDIVEKLGFESW